MKLYIDDIRNAPDDSWVVARTVQTAIKAIHQFGSDLTEISFDHDISHQVSIGSGSRPIPCGETFQSVAHYLGLAYENLEKLCASHGNGARDHDWDPIITIHSANPVGAQEIQHILGGYGLESTIEQLPPANRLEMLV